MHDRVLDELREQDQTRVIVELWADDLPQARARDWRARGPALRELEARVRTGAPGFEVQRTYRTQPYLAGRVDRRALEQLMVAPGVSAVWPVRPLRALLDDSGPLIGQPEAELAGWDGSGVGIAILDTGVDYLHPDLGGAPFPNAKVIGGWNFVSDTADPMDDDAVSGHGTHVAGIAAGTGSTYRGIAPGAHVLALKVLDSQGRGYSDDILAAVDWCIVNQDASHPEHGDYNIRVMNLSLGDDGEYGSPEECADPLTAALQDAVDQGILVVAAAGNQGYLGGVSYPACASAAVAVGATYDRGYPGQTLVYSSCSDSSPAADGVACFSNRGEMVELFAPGAVITSAQLGGGYRILAGTSMAAPHVAGAAACLAGAGITDPDEIRARLRRTGVQIVDELTKVGTPRVDLVRAMANAPTSGPDLVVTALSTTATSAAVGETIEVDVTVMNRGDQAAGSFTTMVGLSRNQIASPQDAAVATFVVPGLGPGESHVESGLAGTIPAVPGENYWLVAYADSEYQVPEWDETSNGLVGPALQVVSPGARVVASAIPAFMLKGQTSRVHVQMYNDGTVTWVAGEYELASQSPAGNTTWGPSRIPLAVGSVAPGQTVTFSFDITAPSEPGWHPCHWQMARGAEYFGEVATGATRMLVVDDARYGQDMPSVAGSRVAYVDYSGLWRDYLLPQIGVKDLNTGQRWILPDDIPFPRDSQGWPIAPYTYFDISNHLYPEVSGDWVTWTVDDRQDPVNPDLWYYQVTAYNPTTPQLLPRRIVWNNWDAAFSAIDGFLVVWEDYRNDPNRIMDPWNVAEVNADIYIADLRESTGTYTVGVYPLCRAPGAQYSPRISGRFVVWEDWRDGQPDIYLYDLSVDSNGDGVPNWKDPNRPDPDPAEIRLTATPWAEYYPDVSERWVVWLDTRRLYEGSAESIDIYALDLETMTEVAVATDPPNMRRGHVRVHGDQVVWHERRQGQSDVFLADLSLGFTIPLAGSRTPEDMPAIGGPQVAYARYRGTVYHYLPAPYNTSVWWDVYNVLVDRLHQHASVGVHTFPDVTTAHWASAWIEAIAAAGLVGGYPDGTYAPSLPVARDQMAVFVARALEGGDEYFETYLPGEPTFPDVPEDHWAYKYIEYCADPEQDIVRGFPDGTYRPGIEVTRGQMAVFIARGVAGGDAGVPTGPAEATFPDVQPEGEWGWCFDYVEYIAERAITGGYPDGRYHPEYVCTRDQMAVFISRGFEYTP